MGNPFHKSHLLVEEHIKNENLRKHCYAVESCMRYYARKLVQNEKLWASVGLLHDLDWEKYPETHPNTAVAILQEAGFDNEFINIILSHAYPERTNVPRDTLVKKYLFACDEITGLVTAYALMKPEGINGVEAKGVIKKMKDKAFARSVNRDDIRKGAEEIEMNLETHITNIIQAMREDKRLF
ncbi:MAG: HDIG domain-containing metalloprotein [Ignavibacteria bacterium]